MRRRLRGDRAAAAAQRTKSQLLREFIRSLEQPAPREAKAKAKAKRGPKA